MNKSKVISALLAVTVFSLFTFTVYAASSDFLAKATAFFNKNCTNTNNIPNSTAILCYLYDKVQEHDVSISTLNSTQSSQSTQINTLNAQITTNTSDIAKLKGYKAILDIQDVRGSSFTTISTTAVATPDKVTMNCPVQCLLLIDYFVDTRNNSNAGAPPSGFNNIYDIYVDGVNEAIFTQASFPVPNAAIPLALNGVVLGNAGTHVVQIYAYTNGGELESFESGLQVIATTP